ncbi:MAG: HAD family hydrolase [Alphaproteobacteria bacterium]|jgi:phosphoglycolate phosphatase|nr:HAD family hydrolase [Alphaproteobacteria bacterium]MCB1550942.1 HAD family hydrolase [Alphaproteobacteria bacterium]MCB9985749.1 HAD family hydrolase [Micavibrio sp.]HPQ50619.1 HAD hydrolase-like protein [Alphaproteobacteria bacterium]HRK97619.1 HAD hydrolase-like protein [Alphaproteobacteria bacterium]
MALNLAIFDWNGTLMDDAQANLEGCNATMAAAGRPPITMERYRETMDFPVIHLYTRNGIDTDTYLANINQYGQVFLDKYKEEAKSAVLKSGSHDLLDALLDAGFTTMVLSNYIQEELESQMAAHHVLHKFHHICGNIDFGNIEHTRMTKLGRLQTILDDNKYDPAKAFIIGDSLEEPEIARHLGMTCFSVTWGCVSTGRLAAGNPDYMVNDLAEVREILKV